MTMPRTTWYKPEPVAANGRKCFCGKPAVGRTYYNNGLQSTYRYQCAEHLPKSGVAFEWSPGGAS